MDIWTTVPDMLSRQAERRPDAIAFEYAGVANDERQRIVFGELDRRARQVAAFLDGVAQQGDRVLLLFPAGLEYLSAFLGCLYAGVVGVPLYPPRPGARGDRIAAVARDCRPRLVLTTQDTLRLLPDGPPFAPPDAVAVYVLDEALAQQGGAERRFVVAPGDLAFLQYTSGSTGMPKGVLVSHRNLVHNERAIANRFAITGEDVVLSWLPLYHDMVLIGTTLLPLCLGIRTILLGTLDFVQDPLRWVVAISEFGATCSGGPNFGYQLLVDRYEEAIRPRRPRW